jgi:hypothetical protein
MVALILPELVDTGETGRDDVRNLCHKLLLIEDTVRPSIKFRIAIEQQDGHDRKREPLAAYRGGERCGKFACA